MAEQGSMIVNGERVDGRTLSFDVEGVKVGNGEEEKVVVPNSFDFAEEPEVNESDFKVYSAPVKKKFFNKEFLKGVGFGIATGVICSCVVNALLNDKE